VCIYTPKVLETLSVCGTKSTWKDICSYKSLRTFVSITLKMLANNTTEIFFSSLYEDLWFKILLAICHIFVTLTAPIILYTIYWYERYGADLRYRTLMNQLLSYYCLLTLFCSLTARFLNCIVFFIGPLPSNYCTFSIFTSRFFFQSGMGEIVIRQIIKFLYIFQWKHLVSLNDDFAAAFLTLFNLVFCAIFSFTVSFLGYVTVEVDFHICTGKDPEITIANAFRYQTWSNHNMSDVVKTYKQANDRDPYVYFNIIAFSLLFLTTAMIWLYANHPNLNKFWTKTQKTILKEEIFAKENEKFEETRGGLIGNGGFFLAVIIAFFLLSPHAGVKEILKTNAANLNHSFGKFMVYFGRITLLILLYYLIPLVIIFTHKKMRATLIRKLSSYFVEIKAFAN
jgi:hypothetical protein